MLRDARMRMRLVYAEYNNPEKERGVPVFGRIQGAEGRVPTIMRGTERRDRPSNLQVCIRTVGTRKPRADLSQPADR